MSVASGRPSLGESLRATAPAWLASRALVLCGYLIASQAVTHGLLHKTTARARLDQGLLSWDAGWYRAIATQGYGGLGRESTRFFPLWPELARGVHELGVPLPWVLVGGASLLWWAALIAIDQLGATLRLDGRRRTTAIWLLCLTPGAIASVLGYSEPLLVLVVASTLALVYGLSPASTGTTGRWLGVALLGALAGASRPIGVLLMVPIAVEATAVVDGCSVPSCWPSSVRRLGWAPSYCGCAAPSVMHSCRCGCRRSLVTMAASRIP